MVGEPASSNARGKVIGRKLAIASALRIDFSRDSGETPLQACICPFAGCVWDVVMLPLSRSLSDPHAEDWNPVSQSDLVQALERQIAGGFPPGLALDLILNELVVRASTATRARSAALALKRGDEMVCRAATGDHAPDLGIPLNTRDGLSGACLRTGQSQLCLDTETDPRVDAATSRRLGIRSMLVVPVLDGEELAGGAGKLACTGLPSNAVARTRCKHSICF